MGLKKGSQDTTVKVSVIIPTYNRADLLPEAVDSFLAQTWNEIEIIVVKGETLKFTSEDRVSVVPTVVDVTHYPMRGQGGPTKELTIRSVK